MFFGVEAIGAVFESNRAAFIVKRNPICGSLCSCSATRTDCCSVAHGANCRNICVRNVITRQRKFFGKINRRNCFDIIAVVAFNAERVAVVNNVAAEVSDVRMSARLLNIKNRADRNVIRSAVTVFVLEVAAAKCKVSGFIIAILLQIIHLNDGIVTPAAAFKACPITCHGEVAVIENHLVALISSVADSYYVRSIAVG